MSRIRSLALLAGAAGLLLSGCSNEVSTSDLETQISSQLEKQVGQAPDDVSCDKALPAEEDANVKCVLTAGDQKYQVDVTASSVDGNKVSFNIKVADSPMS